MKSTIFAPARSKINYVLNCLILLSVNAKTFLLRKLNKQIELNSTWKSEEPLRLNHNNPWRKLGEYVIWNTEKLMWSKDVNVEHKKRKHKQDGKNWWWKKMLTPNYNSKEKLSFLAY